MTAASILTTASAIGALGAAVTGLRAAWLWYRASKVTARPDFGPTQFEPVDPTLTQMVWTGAILKAARASSELNAQAAGWTVAAVIFAAIQSSASFLASAFA